MLSNLFRNDRGFTLVELIMVIVIIGILASIAVPKFVNLSGAANDAKCDANRGAISSAIAMFYADTLVKNPNAAGWLAAATLADVKAAWFATGAVPTCPTTGVYTVTNGNCSCSVHGS